MIESMIESMIEIDYINNILIIPDTNVLLYMYKCSFNTSQNISTLLAKVKENMIIPYQVYTEYLEHKDEEQAKIDKKYDTFTKELKQKVSNAKADLVKSIGESRKYDFPDCKELEDDILYQLHQIQERISTYQKSLGIEKSNKANQISNVEQLINFFISNEKITKELSLPDKLKYIEEGEFRFRYKMPPGYMDEENKDKEWQKDTNKKDNFTARTRKYGDLFIWKDILNLGIDNPSKKIIFITNDVKEDWWIVKGANKIAVKMRDELYEEFVALTSHRSIEFMTLPDFYSQFSQNYQIQDIKTKIELELSIYVYYIIDKYKAAVTTKSLEVANEIEMIDIDDEYMDFDRPKFNICSVQIKNANVHFEEESAIYDIIFEIIMSIEFTKTDNEGDIFEHRIANTVIEISAEVQRDILNDTEDEIIFKTSKYIVDREVESVDICEQQEEDFKDEVAGTIVEYYNH